MAGSTGAAGSKEAVVETLDALAGAPEPPDLSFSRGSDRHVGDGRSAEPRRSRMNLRQVATRQEWLEAHRARLGWTLAPLPGHRRPA